MAIYWPTPGFKGRTFKLCILTRWDFNFCVRSSPLRERQRRRRRSTISALKRRDKVIVRQAGNIRAGSKHRYRAGRITNCAGSVWKCRSAHSEHSGQKLLPVLVRRLWNQIDIDRARVVTESVKRGIHLRKFFCEMLRGAHEPVY